MPKTTAAVVVAFNRKQLLTECLDGLLRQTAPLNAIYIIDNASTDGTDSYLQHKGYLAEPRIRYIRLSINTGGAGGFYRGMQEAFQAGYDWLWLMDDDTEPQADALMLMEPYKRFSEVVAIANEKIDIQGNTTYDGLRMLPGSSKIQVPYRRVKFSSFVGILIRSTIVRQIGFPRPEFFIHNDDLEYCLRLRKKGDIALAEGSIVRHKEQARQIVPKTLLGFSYFPKTIHDFCFEYFGHRNYTATQQIHGGAITRFALPLRRFLLALTALLLFDRTGRWMRVKILLRANRDGYLGRFDNTYPFRLRDTLKSKSRATSAP